jgi:hypothetical protein
MMMLPLQSQGTYRTSYTAPACFASVLVLAWLSNSSVSICSLHCSVVLNKQCFSVYFGGLQLELQSLYVSLEVGPFYETESEIWSAFQKVWQFRVLFYIDFEKEFRLKRETTIFLFHKLSCSMQDLYRTTLA